MEAAIAICGPGVSFSKIGEAIEKVAKENKVTLVKDFVGHGVGKVGGGGGGVSCRV